MSNRKELPGRPDAIFSMVEDYSRQKEYDKAERLIENYADSRRLSLEADSLTSNKEVLKWMSTDLVSLRPWTR